MISIVKYEELENDINVGFRRNGYIVYGSIGKEDVEGLNRNRILQEAYKQVKDAMDYEESRYDEGLPNSITSNEDLPEDPEEFIPEEPMADRLDLMLGANTVTFRVPDGVEGVPIDLTLFDQYGGTLASKDVVIEGVTIEDDVVIVEDTGEVQELVITASHGPITTEKTIMVYPYVEPEPTDEQLRIQGLEENLEMNTMVLQELLWDVIPELMMGGMGGE